MLKHCPCRLSNELYFLATENGHTQRNLQGHSKPLEHFDNIFLTYTVLLHDWLNQPGYGALFILSFLASTLLPVGSEWLLVMMLVNGFDPAATIASATR